MTEDLRKPGAPEVRQVGLADLAAVFNLTPKKLEHELALLGWGVIYDAAERQAHAEYFNESSNNQRLSATSLEDLERKWKSSLRWEHLVAAAKEFLPHLEGKPATRVPAPKEHLGGYLYVLYDGITKMSKIGCTRDSGKRQRAIMGGHGSVLINVVNAEVADRRSAEAQCHKHFKDYRTNGEWFNADLKDIIEYIHMEVAWESIEFENMGRMTQYIVACRNGDLRAAKAAVFGMNFPEIQT